MSRRGMRITIVAALGLFGGCDSSGGSTATLIVHIGLFGGPLKPGGGMALSNSPARGENVTALDTRGGPHVASTNAVGTVTMHLPPGEYTIFSTYCGPRQHIELAADRTAHVRIDCAVP